MREKARQVTHESLDEIRFRWLGYSIAQIFARTAGTVYNAKYGIRCVDGTQCLCVIGNAGTERAILSDEPFPE